MVRKKLAGGLIVVCALLAMSACSKQDESGASAQGGAVIDLAPADANMAIVVDFKKLMESGILDSSETLKAMNEQKKLPIDPQMTGQMAFFVSLNPKDLEAEPIVTGVLTHTDTRENVEKTLEKESLGTSVEVAGLKAYKIEGDLLAAMADDKAVVFGSTKEALAQMIAARKKGKGAPPKALKDAISKYGKSHVRLALVLSDELKKNALESSPNPDMPDYLKDVDLVAAGLDITKDKLCLDSAVTFGKSASAKQAADAAANALKNAATQFGAQIEQAEQAAQENPMVPLMEVAHGILKGMKVSAKGAEMQFTMSASVTDLEKMISFVPMLLMRAMMGGGGGAGPGTGPGM